MKITCSKKQIIDNLAPVCCCLPAKKTGDILNCIHVRADADGVIATAYDLEKGIKSVFEADVRGEGCFAADGDKLMSILRNLPDTDVTLETGSGHTLRITAGRSEFEIMTMNPEDYPPLPDFSGDRHISLDAEGFRRMVGKVLHAVAPTDTKPALTGILIKIKEGKMEMVATDTFRLAVAYGFCVGHEGPDASIIIPGRSAAELVKIVKGEGNLQICLSKKYISVGYGNILFFSRVLEGEFLDYERALPKESKLFVEVNTEDMMKCVERAALLSDERMRAPVKLLISEGAVRFQCSSMNGKVNDEIPAQTEGEGMEIGFNTRYLLDSLRNTESESVILRLTGPSMSMLITPDADSGDYLFLVLPVRMKD